MVDMEKGSIWEKRGFFLLDYSTSRQAYHMCNDLGKIRPSGYKTKLLRCPKRMNAEKYIKMILENDFFSNLNSQFGANYLSQQDEAPPHK